MRERNSLTREDRRGKKKKKKTKKVPHAFMWRCQCSYILVNHTLSAALNYSSARY